MFLNWPRGRLRLHRRGVAHRLVREPRRRRAGRGDGGDHLPVAAAPLHACDAEDGVGGGRDEFLDQSALR